MKRLILAASLAAITNSVYAVELTLWAPSGFTPGAGLQAVGEEYADLYARFEAENPGVTIKWELLSGGTEALTQILTASTAGNLPDLAVLDGFWIARIVETGRLQSLSDMWSEEARALFYPEPIEAVTFDGEIYAAWFHNAWRGLYYKEDELSALGFEAAPENWEEFQAVLAAARDVGKHGIMVPALASELTALHMLPIFWGLGGELVDEDGRPVFHEGDNATKLEQVYQIYADLATEGFMPVDVATMDEAAIRPYFYSNEAAIVGQTSSGITQMYADQPELEGNLGAFSPPIPSGESAVPVLVGWTYGIFAEDEERKAAAWKFVEFVLRPENIGRLNAAAGHLPVIQEIWDQDFYRNDELMQRFKAIYEAGGMRARPAEPIYPTITLAWAEQMAEVLAGNISPAQAVENASEQVMLEYNRMSSR